MKKSLHSAICLMAAMAGIAISAGVQAPSQKPNVLFIVADDLNSWSLLNDYPVLKAPAIRELMAQSYYFMNATCAAPVCVPSRASFFSGKYPHHSGVYRNVPDVWSNVPLLTEVEALPEMPERRAEKDGGTHKNKPTQPWSQTWTII